MTILKFLVLNLCFSCWKIFITENFCCIWCRIYTVSDTKFGRNCTHCFLFLVTCKQNLLPVGQVLMARPKHKMFW